MPVVVNYPPPSSVVVNEVTGAVTVVAAGPRGIQGEPGVVTATSPATYDAPTQTVGVDQTAISIQPSQVAGTAVVDNDTRLLPAGGAAGEVLVKSTATNFDTVWAVRAAGVSRTPGHYRPAGTGRTNVSTLNSRGFFMPFYFESPVTVNGIGINITVAGNAASEVRLGLYANASGVPGGLIVDAGVVAADATGASTIAVTPVSISGLVWAVLVAQNAATTAPQVPAHVNTDSAYVTHVAAGLSGSHGCFVSAANSIAGALPSTAPTVGANTNQFLIALEIA
jgi:hypothetical protein